MKFCVVAKSSPCTLSSYERLKTMESYELITLKSCRGCLREVLLLGILQRLRWGWLMRDGGLRAVVARWVSTALTTRTFLTLNTPCSFCSSNPSRLKTRSSRKISCVHSWAHRAVLITNSLCCYSFHFSVKRQSERITSLLPAEMVLPTHGKWNDRSLWIWLKTPAIFLQRL